MPTKDKMTARLCLLGKISASIAHEVNTPLAILQLRLELLQEGVQNGTLKKEDLLVHLKTLLQTTQRISKIVESVRVLSRDGSVEPAKTVNLNSMLQETLDFCSGKFQSQGIKLT